ncbi:MAG: hypothetical protein KKE86_03755 [Planctomycetes bacterium]|nr:hypothetical protein [Planctomycetota bacterium]MBU4398433.1 hypothetical protein [Planctomycetota bacterium]MCG2683400.1 hypothetical protein [Planctomycetales bacterium]
MSTGSFLEQLVRDTRKPEAEVLALAVEAGVRQLWREHVLGQYLRGEISRQQAAETVGMDWVDMAERQRRAMEEDLEWGLAKTSSP